MPCTLFERKEVDRIILSRPAVEAGERLGFLPGDMREKVDPYLRPIYDALYDLMDARIVERALQTGEIEIAPLAFMRGRTLTNAVVILDEAQNTTSMQMKMFLTRLGENSRMIVTGDPSQVDLPHGQTSGLAEAMRLLDGVEGIGTCTFTRRGRDPPRTGGAHRRRLRQGAARGTQARGEGMSAGPSRPPTTAPVAAIDVDRSIPPRWQAAARRRSGLVRRAVRGRGAGAGADGAELAVMLTDDGRIRTLNRRLARQGRADQRAVVPGGAGRAGAGARRACSATSPSPIETDAREARDEGKPFDHHLSHLAVHGFLHLSATITRRTTRPKQWRRSSADPRAARHPRPLCRTRC